MEKLYKEIVATKERKEIELSKTSKEIIDYPVLQCEIEDTEDILKAIENSDSAGIEKVYDQTTSKSIFESVNRYHERLKQVK